MPAKEEKVQDQEDAPDAKGRRPSQIRRQFSQDSIRALQAEITSQRKLDEFLESARPKATGDPCVAYYLPTHECLITPEALDANLAQISATDLERKSQPQLQALASLARTQAIQAILAKAFFNNAENPIFQNALDRAHHNRMAGYQKESKGLDENQVNRLYQAYFISFARAQAKLRFEVYASSDSIFIQDLYHDLIESGNARDTASGKKMSESRNSISRNWCPMQVSIREVPPNWFQIAKILRPGEWTHPLVLPFGYAIFRINRAPPTLHEMLPVLSILAHLGDLPDEKELKRLAQQYYSNHSNEFIGIDTMNLSVRLIPQPIGADLRPISLMRRGGDSLIEATAIGFHERLASQIDLPAKVRADLRRSFSMCRDNSARFFQSEYGNWSICLRDKGNHLDTLPFARVETLISNQLRLAQLDTILAEALQSVAMKEKEQASVDLRRTMLQSLIENINAQEVEARVHSDSTEPESASRTEAAQHTAEEEIRLQMAEEKLDSIRNKWIQENISFTIDPK